MRFPLGNTRCCTHPRQPVPKSTPARVRSQTYLHRLHCVRRGRSNATMYSGLLVLSLLEPPEQTDRVGDGAPRRGSDGVCGRSKQCEATAD